MKFTYAAYEDMINLLKQNNYQIMNYYNYQTEDKCAILRHDVDMSLEKAVEIANLEKRLGVCSTYYVLISSEFYNIHSKRSARCLDEIVKCGHDIGLHFDEERYNGNLNILECMEQEIDLLEMYLGRKIKSVSMHRPSKMTLEANYTIRNGDVINSYGEEFFTNFKYVSDSRKQWRENVLQIVQSSQYNRLHILTHPIWYETEERSMHDQLKQFCNDAVEERYAALADNIRDLGEILRSE